MTTSKPNDVLRVMEAFIRYQYSANTRITLSQFYTMKQLSYIIHPDLLDFFSNEAKTIEYILKQELSHPQRPDNNGLIRLFLTGTLGFINQNNQFLSLSPQQQAALQKIYIDYLEDMKEILSLQRNRDALRPRLQAVIARHLQTLQSFMLRLAEDTTDAKNLFEAQAICAHYPPQLQLEILGVDLSGMKEPILDVGCGESATLVHYLRQAGLEAYGIDRSVLPAQYVWQHDWLGFDFHTRRWGTILSHMAFSNHFVFHHRYKHGIPTAYAQKYMEMLKSLKPGGSLYYTPGLPFIEQLLPKNHFSISKKMIFLPQHKHQITKEEQKENSYYAAKVTRLHKSVS